MPISLPPNRIGRSWTISPAGAPRPFHGTSFRLASRMRPYVSPAAVTLMPYIDSGCVMASRSLSIAGRSIFQTGTARATAAWRACACTRPSSSMRSRAFSARYAAAPKAPSNSVVTVTSVAATNFASESCLVIESRAFSLRRHPDRPPPSAAGAVVGGDRAAVVADDLLHDGQAEAAAAGAAGEKRLEQVREVLGAEAGAVVGDREDERRRGLTVLAHAQQHRLVGGGELDGVLHHVLEHLQHAVGVDRQGREVGRELRAQLDPLLLRPRRADAHRLGHDRPDRLHAPLAQPRAAGVEQ